MRCHGDVLSIHLLLAYVCVVQNWVNQSSFYFVAHGSDGGADAVVML
jgi:hypothetical protein